MAWSQILIPALVAACVSLGMEFAAKPGLEMRKERILAKARRRLDAVAVLRQVLSDVIAYEQFSHEPDSSASAHNKHRWLQERERFRSQLADQATDIYRSSAAFNDDADDLIYPFLTAAAGAVRGAAVSDRTQSALEEAEADLLLTSSIELLESSRWSVGGRKLRRAARPWLRSKTHESAGDAGDSA